MKLYVCKDCYKKFRKEQLKAKKIETYLEKAIAEIKKVSSDKMDYVYQIRDIIFKLSDDILRKIIKKQRKRGNKWT
jgi:ribosome-binding protein aMBF1 (putative translation factor)